MNIRFLAFIILAFIFCVMLFGPSQHSAFLLVKDASESARNSGKWVSVISSICGEDYKGKLDKEYMSTFASINYADHADSYGQWIVANKVEDKECENLRFDPLKKGTNPQEAVSKAKG
jgi:hypothetical protein